MNYLNVLYFAEYDDDGNVVAYVDCDLIAVPDYVAENSGIYEQSFFRWLESNEATEEYYYVKNDRRILNCETKGFVRWLNKYITPKEPSIIVKQHIPYCSDYNIIDF